MMLYRRGVFRLCGLATLGLVALSLGAAAQTEQKSAKDLIVGTWTLMIADNVRADGNKVPGFGPLPSGTARFGADGRYTLEVMPNSSSTSTSSDRPQTVSQGQAEQGGLRHSGTYALDESHKSLTLRIEDSSLPNWRGTTQTGTMKFVTGDHLGWTNSVPLVGSADFVATELIWARAK
jgi:Lipocalin-like domain